MSDEDELFEKYLRLELPRGRSAKPKTGSLDRRLQARWLTPEELTGNVWNPEGGMLLGKRAGRLIGWKDNRHMLTIGGSRAGKGVSLIVPNLTFYKGSALVVDPKGENARITAGRRGEGTEAGGPGLGQTVHVIDPFGVSGRDIASLNPLSELNIRNSNVAEDAATFADALIEHPPHGERHWTESAQSILRALILVTLAERQPSRRNLVTDGAQAAHADGSAPRPEQIEWQSLRSRTGISGVPQAGRSARASRLGGLRVPQGPCGVFEAR